MPYATIRLTKIVLWKFDHAKYVYICKVVNHLGSEVSVRLTQTHAIMGCDTTSFLHNVGKVKVLWKMIKDPSSLSLLEGNWKSKLLESSAVKSKVVQVICYNGKEKEQYTETRVRLYKSMKTKS